MEYKCNRCKKSTQHYTRGNHMYLYRQQFLRFILKSIAYERILLLSI